MPTQNRSYSKINLGLTIGPLRPDTFHGLTTIYQTLALHDLVTIEARPTPGEPTQITLSTNSPFVPATPKNTAWRMVESALHALGITAAVHIHIDKRLPVQGGLGAGSANAVAALIGLEHELATTGFDQQLDQPTRLALATRIGSDVPLFLTGGTMLGLGRGEDIHPLPDLPPTNCVIVAPSVGVSTPDAFRDWDQLHPTPEAAQDEDQPHPLLPPSTADNLTANPPSDTVKRLSRPFADVLSEPHSSGVFSWREGLAENPLLALVRTGIENDFEQVVFPKHPPLGDIKRLLAASSDPEHAAIYTALSGSGSALFGLYATEAAAEAAIQRLERHGARKPGFQVFRTKTLPRQDYWSTMVVGA